MATVNQSKRYIGNRSVYFGDELPETDLEEGFLFFKIGDGLYVYRNLAWEIISTVPGPGGTTVTSFNSRTGDITLVVGDITSIDGPGSGIDADMLDGVHASGFSTTAHDHTGVYSPIVHNHDGSYSPTGHTHAGQYLPTDMNYNNVGSLCFVTSISATANPGTTIAGSSLYPCGIVKISQPDGVDQFIASVSALSGTWRILGYMNVGSPTLAQRIA